jgi:serine/alanine adding enzyme
MRPDSTRNQRLIRIWQRLPVWLTRQLGPLVVRGIP